MSVALYFVENFTQLSTIFLVLPSREQLDEATKRVAHLEEVLDGKEDLEKQQKGRMSQHEDMRARINCLSLVSRCL